MNFQLADLTIDLDIDNKKVQDIIKDRYTTFIGEDHQRNQAVLYLRKGNFPDIWPKEISTRTVFNLGTEFTVFRRSGDWFVHSNRGNNTLGIIKDEGRYYFFFRDMVGNFLRNLDFFIKILFFDFLLPPKEALAVNGMAYKTKDGFVNVCLGESEDGKSTLARKLIKSGATILNDDVLIIRHALGRFFCYSTPFMRNENIFSNDKGQIGKVFFLAKDNKDFITPITDTRYKIKKLKKTADLYFTSLFSDFRLNFLFEMVERLEFFEYHFQK